MRHSLVTATIGIFLYGFFSFAAEDESINTKPLKSEMKSVQTLKIGEETVLTFQLSLASGYHAYADKFALKVLDNSEIIVSKFEPSPIVKFVDVLSKKEKEGIKDEAQLKAWVKLTNKIMPGPKDVTFELTYQACTDKHCLFPTKLQIPTKLVIVNSEIMESSAPATLTKPSASTLSFESALQKGMGYTFLFVFFAGILTSLTPCIFPMIPITLSIIGASQIRGGPGSHEAKTHSRFRGFSLSVAYVLGIALTYSILGVIAAETGALFGAALSNPIVVSAIAIAFVTLGLSMYGLFEIQMPAFIRDRLSATKTDAGYIGAFIAGLIAGVVASPCVGPVLVSILTYVAQTQDAIVGFFLLFTFAIGMGLLLIALGTFSSLTRKLPRSGAWMEFVKFIFGSAMISMALYYIRPLLPLYLFYICFGATCILVSSYFGAFEANEKLNVLGRLRKGTMITLLILGVTYFVRGVMHDTQIKAIGLPFLKTEDSSTAWKAYSDAEFENALSSGKPVIIDFYADWCAACKELERFTFSDPTVKNKLSEFALFRVDMTVETNENSGLKDKFNIIGLPTLHIFNHGKILKNLTLTGFESKGDFINRLNQAL